MDFIIIELAKYINSLESKINSDVISIELSSNKFTQTLSEINDDNDIIFFDGDEYVDVKS